MNLANPKKHIPWIVYEAKDWLDEFLKKDMRVFEWGSGGSTFYFSKRTKKVVSVEHDDSWHKKVEETLLKEKINNCEYHLIAPYKNYLSRILPLAWRMYKSEVFTEYKNYTFKKYVKKISDYPDNFFDLIFVDGRARAACMRHAVRKIKKGGFLMLDNSERKSYRNAMGKLRNFQRRDFFGHGPYSEDKWQTSVWHIN
ncbi:MAG: hypothetical protein WC858_00085 [Parcubacteria group bacterium]|jgi:hypothetical protein